MKGEQFSNRWGIVLASLGMAIGAGNLWRFPRLAGQYGGAFILLWIVFLLIWSVPLLLAEFSIGKKFRKGVVGSFGSLAGKNLTWMGFFIALCTLGIAFYYSVVSAWSIEYLFISLYNVFLDIQTGTSLSERLDVDPAYLSDQWQSLSNRSWVTVLTYIAVVVVGVLVVARGVQSGLEKANRLLIPSLFVLLIVVAVSALTMDNGMLGLQYMFSIHWGAFSDANIWIEALSQSAWSTGAGWGLMITLSSYSRDGEDVTLNTLIGAFGNNTASLMAGMALLPAVFALATSESEAVDFLQAGNHSMTFIIIPELFAGIPFGRWMTVLFFLALSLAAFSSFLPMVELLRSHLTVIGVHRSIVTGTLLAVFVVLGFPSAWSFDFFNNQDWVWGLGLIVSGMFICVAVVKYGSKAFKEQLMDGDSDIRVPQWLFGAAMAVNIVLGIGLIYWWMAQGYSANPWFDEGAWNVWDIYSNATIVTQWGAVIMVGLLLNGWLYKHFVISNNAG